MADLRRLPSNARLSRKGHDQRSRITVVLGRVPRAAATQVRQGPNLRRLRHPARPRQTPRCHLVLGNLSGTAPAQSPANGATHRANHGPRDLRILRKCHVRRRSTKGQTVLLAPVPAASVQGTPQALEGIPRPLLEHSRHGARSITRSRRGRGAGPPAPQAVRNPSRTRTGVHDSLARSWTVTPAWSSTSAISRRARRKSWSVVASVMFLGDLASILAVYAK